MLFAVLAAFAWRQRDPNAAGRLSGVFLIGYALARSFAELFREPDAHIGFLWGEFTMGQLLSLPMLLVGLALVAWSFVRQGRAGLERS